MGKDYFLHKSSYVDDNVIIGHQIPAGTGVKFKDVVVGSKVQLEELQKESADTNSSKNED